MRKAAILAIALMCMVSTAAIAHAAPPPHAGKGQQTGQKKDRAQGQQDRKGNQPDKSRDNAGKGRTHEGELIRATITALTAREIALQGGWTGYQPLPPGIAKNLARGKALPLGIAKKALPGGMLGRLPHYDGYEWYSVGRDLVLINAASLLIADILHNVFD